MDKPMDDAEFERRIAGSLGWYEVEGDPYCVVRAPEGGMLAHQLDGTPISPAWVISRGRRIAPPDLPDAAPSPAAPSPRAVEE